ncbi:TolC family protein [Hymenobacter cellulosilyticus]|uniref:TolC family protein n=1 Tax=Hymenobacter cellulosilyticus TaxID=2932248 RepID=UPI0028806F01|nr:efflux transporter outer membrane subunit [Hymenobacter cellulosilyticus]
MAPAPAAAGHPAAGGGLPGVERPAPARAAPARYLPHRPTADTASVASLPWRSFFTEPALQQLLDSATVRNNDLQLALQNIASAQTTLRQARLGYLPAATLQAGVTTNRPSGNSLNGISLTQFLGTKHIEDYNLAAALSWEADIWGKIRSRKQEALAAYLQSQEARKAVQTQVVAQVAQGYYNLLMLDTQLEVARRNVALTDSTLRFTRLQFRAGQVTALAVQQVEVQRLTAAGLVPQLEQAITVQEDALSILAGRLPGGISRSGNLLRLRVPVVAAAGVPAALLARRPDVRSAELALDRANAAVGYTKAQLYPALTITAQGGLNAFQLSNWFSLPASLFGTVVGGLTQPLFQRGALRAQYQQAQIDRERTVIQFRQQVLVAVGEVSDALGQVERTQTQQALATERVRTLREATRNANLLFGSGLASYLEVITAQSNALQSELELASLKRTQLEANVELYRAVGGGWQ